VDGVACGGLPAAGRPSRVPTAAASPDRADLQLAGGLALLTLGSRVPLWGEYAFNWDAANFALAVLHFDVREHRPHPPGYFYYVVLGRLTNLVLDDPNRSLTLASTLLSAGTVAAVYLLGRCVYRDRTVGVGAAVFLLTSVTFWAYGLVALAYPALALFGTLVGLAALTGRSILAAAALGIGSGFRPDLVLLAGPLWLWSMRQDPWGRRLASAVLLGLLGLGWFLPTAFLSGGIPDYLQTMRVYLDQDVWQRYAPGARGLAALGVNLRDTAAYVFYGLYLTAIPVALGLLRLGREALSGRLDPDQAVWFALWVGPPLAFYTLVHIGDPGYIFSFLPALTLVAAWGLRGGRRLFWAGLVAVALLNCGVFFFHPRVLTYPGLVAADASLRDRLEALDRFPAESTLVVAAESFRAVQFYRPAYAAVWVDRRRGEDTAVSVPAGIQQVVIFDPTLTVPDGRVVYGPTAGVVVIGARPGQVLVVRP
jgi:hypothetical protein